MEKKNALKTYWSSLEKREKIIFLFFLFILTCSFFYLIFFPQIHLKGKQEIKLNYQETYKEPGYSAEFLGKDLSSKIHVKNSVDVNRLGTYQIEYSLRTFPFFTKTVRKVTVGDYEKPVLTLKGSETASVCPNQEYQEEGYEVTDNYDKDLKDQVKVKKEKDKITYTVTDSSKNKTTVTRHLKYEDVDKPELTLKGSQTMSLEVGQTYNEPGYQAIDNCSGDLTDKVTVEGNVDTSKAGTYELHYKIKDESGNETTATRKVKVYAKSYVSSGCGYGGDIYLTFDDGPGAGTSKILDVLKEEGVKATFFVTASGSDALIKRAYQEGHTIALHTASHNYAKIYSSVDNYFADLKVVSDRVKRITGVESKYIRFPGGSSNTISRNYHLGIMTALTNEVLNRGYKYFDWNIDSNDAGACASKNPTASCVYEHVTKYLSKSRCNMVLMHDVKNYTADALRDIIRYGKENGYTFKAITSSTGMVTHQVNN